MKKLAFTLALMLVFTSTDAFSADDFFGLEETDEFAPAAKAETATDETKKMLSTFLSSRLSATAARNIEKAEKIFCYTVAYADPQTEGYTLNGMAIKGSCGELSANGKKLFEDVLWRNTSVFSGAMDNCSISPKIMLRYIYGPDTTDVLISYPCPAVTFYHGRDVVTVNAAPSGNLLEQITKAYTGLSESYVSPALLGQIVPNGQILNQAQKEKVRRSGNSELSRKKWDTEPAISNNDTSATTSTAKTGWNKLK